MAPVLIIFGGLPRAGKTSIAKELACHLGGVYLRIDPVEQAIRGSGVADKSLYDMGYRVSYSVAEDNLRLGRTVIADSVNPLQLTRDAWIDVADRAGADAVEVEITCSDLKQHRQRVETRVVDIEGLRPPTWQEVVARQYQPWNREHIVIDTAGRSVAESVKELREALAKRLIAVSAIFLSSNILTSLVPGLPGLLTLPKGRAGSGGCLRSWRFLWRTSGCRQG